MVKDPVAPHLAGSAWVPATGPLHHLTTGQAATVS